MEDLKPIDLQRKRDFSMKMNATFEFVKRNYKSLFKSILVIAGPPALIGSLLVGSFLGDMMSMMTSLGTGGGDPSILFRTSSFWLQILLLLVFGTLTFVFTISTINNYIILYGEKRTNQIEVSEVWERVRQTFWMYFGTAILFGVLFMLVYFVLLIPTVLLVAISPFLVFFGVMIVFVGLFYILFSASLTFFIRGYEKKSFFESISRSFYLVRSKWWSTFGLIMILSMIVGFVSYIFMIPYYVVIFSTALHQTEAANFAGPTDTMILVTKISFTFYYLAQILLSTLPNVGIAFQYFNLVELKEAKGLMKDLENFGQTPDPLANRPEENY
jgi:hypothetical protein